MTSSEQELRRTSLYETHKARRRQDGALRGYEMPVSTRV